MTEHDQANLNDALRRALTAKEQLRIRKRVDQFLNEEVPAILAKTPAADHLLALEQLSAAVGDLKKALVVKRAAYEVEGTD